MKLYRNVFQVKLLSHKQLQLLSVSETISNGLFQYKLILIRSHLAKTDNFNKTKLINHVFHIGILSEKLTDLTIPCLKWIPE